MRRCFVTFESFSLSVFGFKNCFKRRGLYRTVHNKVRHVYCKSSTTRLLPVMSHTTASTSSEPNIEKILFFVEKQRLTCGSLLPQNLNSRRSLSIAVSILCLSERTLIPAACLHITKPLHEQLLLRNNHHNLQLPLHISQ